MLRRISIYGLCIVLTLFILIFFVNQIFYNSLEEVDVKYYKNNNYENYYKQIAQINNNNVTLINDVLSEQKLEIYQEMTNYNYLPGENLLKLTPDSGGTPKRSLIFATWRSGSTFLGDVLNSVPANYYHYEPFSDYDIVQIRGPPEADNAIERIKQLLKCDYSQNFEYFLEYVKSHPWVFTHNNRLWDQCHQYRNLCYNTTFLCEFCRLFPFQSMKIVRLRIRLAEELLNDKSLNVKILLLVRDPRGTMQSRRHREWCPGNPDCEQPTFLCADLVSDFSAAIRLKQRFPDRFRVIRYEDMSLDPQNQIKELFNFFELDFGQPVLEFLESHTKFDMGGVSSTFRNSKIAPFHWRSDLTYEEIKYVEQHCHEAMNLWGYVPIPNDASEEFLRSFNPLTNYKVER